MKKSYFVFFSIFILASALASYAQLTPEMAAERSKWEDFLKTGKIIKSEKVGEGVTKPKKLLLKKGDLEAYAIWKRPSGLGAEYNDKWEGEIAAYRMDKLLGVNMVPPTVERRYKLSSGSLQLWVSVPMNEKRRTQENIPIPDDKLEHYEKMRSLQRVFDSLIANSDRTLQNLRYTEDWQMILIDHSRAFRDSYPYTNLLIYGKNGLVPQEFGKLPRPFTEKVRALNFDIIRKAVESYLTNSEIKAILVRKDLFLKEIDELIKEKGEESVLY